MHNITFQTGEYQTNPIHPALHDRDDCCQEYAQDHHSACMDSSYTDSIDLNWPMARAQFTRPTTFALMCYQLTPPVVDLALLATCADLLCPGAQVVQVSRST
ncbi:hypothetical protein N7495_006033 [Penicillium taxi]|uniref:uncharacterized protein n=1 Tax=Penicillium taxi TaxID=168475 RepID=UPI00254598CD|nr:uncharacterized protein N7495_006033 [Penicillium taxi]KAJ5894342.1 hypothetical protein N7495_006033 [Penicillium taxi]